MAAPPGSAVFAYTDTARHDGCLYEAVIYFIIGGRGRYNPRLGNEAIHEERVAAGRFSRFPPGLSSRRPRAAAEIRSEREEHPRFMGSRRLARAFTAANRNYSSRKNARIPVARDSSRDSLAFGKRLFSGIADRSRQLFCRSL